MIGTRRYTLLGWLVWQIGTRVAKKKVKANRTKLGAVAAVGLVLGTALVFARSSDD